MARYQAFQLVTHLDGWRHFCRGWHIEPEALLDFKPGWDMVARTEARTREHAFPFEDAAMFLLSQRPLPEGEGDDELTLPEVLTVQSVSDAWRSFIDRQMKSTTEKNRP
jgi:hypothetical protein